MAGGERAQATQRSVRCRTSLLHHVGSRGLRDGDVARASRAIEQKGGLMIDYRRGIAQF